MKELLKIHKNNHPLLNLDEITLKYIDKDKLHYCLKDIPAGIKNYILFQNFFYFKWPYWLQNSVSIKSKTFDAVAPFFLINKSNRDWICVSNKHSSRRVYIDPAGMVSPFLDSWSVEFWILEKDAFCRPQESNKTFLQKKIESFLISLKWKEANFEFIENIYSLQNDTKELTVELETFLQKGNIPISLFIVIRPYNTLFLGGPESIEYDNKTRLIKIDGYNRIFLENKPDYFLTGNADMGDIEINSKNKKAGSIRCSSGMATLALGYNLNRGSNEHRIRIGLENRKNFNPVKQNFSKLKSEYIEYSSLESKKGLRLTFPDKIFQNWIYAAKISALNFLDNDISKAIDSYNADLKSLYCIISGYNRMGFFQESLRILDTISGTVKRNDKPDFAEILNKCYIINAVSDYFKQSRDIEYIREKYKVLHNIIFPVIKYTEDIKTGKKKFDRNSLEHYSIQELHVHDLILISFSLYEFSYLARCLGIFNDETKFNKESHRLEEIIVKDMENLITYSPEKPDVNEGEADNQIPAGLKYRNEYFAYNIFAGFPFRIKLLPPGKLKAIISKISNSFTENPIYFKSIGGCDIFFSIVYAINLLYAKDSRAHDIIARLFEFGGERYVLPDIVNPKTGCGIRGEGDSVTAVSAFFTLLRSALFLDSEDRLEIFPVPKKEWFINGSEIKIEDAPSVFGRLNFRVITTSDEVQFYFYELPKYIPPAMMINLPFPAKIKREDDFLVKKEMGNSYLLHGWPSMVRFLKK